MSTTATPIELGDRITFRAATRHSDRAATRVVNGFYLGQPTVRYAGSPNFIVRHSEILTGKRICDRDGYHCTPEAQKLVDRYNSMPERS